jgi:sulfhydrogenase subunit beta (sulfur reductase)
MEILKISKRAFNSFIDQKISEKKSRMLGVVQKGSHYVFADLDSADQLCLNYDVTILPPKKFFQPPKEVLLKFVPGKADSYVAVNRCEPITIVGIHYYDLAAIYMMDRAFSDGERDEHYMRKRENSLLIGLYPTKHFKYRFSRSVVKDQYYRVADLMLVDMGDDYAVEVVTRKGKEYLKGADIEKCDYSFKEIDEAKNRIKDDQKIPLPVEMIPEYLANNYAHSAWEYFGEKCFSCGSCVLVCPTCYCFDVREEVELSLAEGRRVRVWDGCMLEDFAVVADGHNFRSDRSARFRHRMFRKGKHLPEKYRYFGCVGCGRCADACTADIGGPVKVLNYIEENK